MANRSSASSRLPGYLAYGGIALIAILVVVVIIRQTEPGTLTPEAGEEFGPDPSIPRGVTEDGLQYLGDPNAPVTLLEYEDYGCPNCKTFAEVVEPSILRDYIQTGQVRLVIYPVAFVTFQSPAIGEAALCAADQGVFWEYREVVFANQGVLSFTRDNFILMAESVDLNTEEFASCFDQGKYQQRVLDLSDAARQFGVTGTPTLEIAGMRYRGVRPYVSDDPQVIGVKAIIDNALSGEEE